jgi:hypothetical protein
LILEKKTQKLHRFETTWQMFRALIQKMMKQQAPSCGDFRLRSLEGATLAFVDILFPASDERTLCELSNVDSSSS